MSGTPDLFVVCKKCGSEVSPYITECPYCGTRLRKRAPKIERDADDEARPKEPRRLPRPRLGSLKPGEMPGIRLDPTARPYATLTLVLLSLFGYLSLAFLTSGDVALVSLETDLWRLVSSAFVYSGAWYELACLLGIGIFGWRLEVRHGPMLVIGLFLACGIGANALGASIESEPFVLGAPGAALGMLIAWVIPDLRRERAGIEHDADLLGALAIAVAIACMPLATAEASIVATAAGAALGALVGLMLAGRPVNAD